MSLNGWLTIILTGMVLSACADLDYQSSGASLAGTGVDDRVHEAETASSAPSVRIDCTGHPEWAGCTRDRALSPDQLFQPR